MDVFLIFSWLELCSSCVGGVFVVSAVVGLRCMVVSRCGKVISWGGFAGVETLGVVVFDAAIAAAVNSVWSGCSRSVISQYPSPYVLRFSGGILLSLLVAVPSLKCLMVYQSLLTNSTRSLFGEVEQ